MPQFLTVPTVKKTKRFKVTSRMRRDPTKSNAIENRYLREVKRQVKKFQKHILDFILTYYTSPIEKTLSRELDTPFNIKNIHSFIDEVAHLDLVAGIEPITEKYVIQAYYQGMSFGTAVLGASVEERQANWLKISTRIQQIGAEWSNYSQREATDIKRIVGTGVIEEWTQGQIIKKIKEVYDMEDYRAERIVRTETMKAINDGVLDRYRRDGIEPRGGGPRPPLHPNCRCTIIVDFEDGEPVLKWLACSDERTCGECADLDGTVI